MGDREKGPRCAGFPGDGENQQLIMFYYDYYQQLWKNGKRITESQNFRIN